MANTGQHRIWIFRIGPRPALVGLTLAIAFVLTVVATPAAEAQAFNVIHNFTGGADGANPQAGLTMDRGGNLYGTTFAGGGGPCTTVYGQNGCGTVFSLVHNGSGWTFGSLHSFTGGSDGALPQLGTLTVAADGSLFGTTTVGGGGGPCSSHGINGCGTIFNLKVPPNVVCNDTLCPWTENVLYRFTGGSDGAYPNGGPIFDQSGNLYGTAGDYPNYGDIYKLAPSGGSWTFSVAFAFSGAPNGQIPIGQLMFDSAGNLYGTTWISDGGNGGGIVFQLTPSGPGWTEQVLHDFPSHFGSDGGLLEAGVIMDSLGNLYGATINGGSGNGTGGTAFELTAGSWTFNLLNQFTTISSSTECGVYGDLVMDSSGSLYGTTACDGVYGKGSVFKLTPSGGTWIYTSLHDFTGGSDGATPYSNIVIDSAGTLYGTAYAGGAGSACTGGCGVVFEITL